MFLYRDMDVWVEGGTWRSARSDLERCGLMKHREGRFSTVKSAGRVASGRTMAGSRRRGYDGDGAHLEGLGARRDAALPGLWLVVLGIRRRQAGGLALNLWARGGFGLGTERDVLVFSAHRVAHEAMDTNVPACV